MLDYNKKEGYAGVVLYTGEYAPASKFYEKTVSNCRKGPFACTASKLDTDQS